MTVALGMPLQVRAAPEDGLKHFAAGEFAEAAIEWRSDADAGDALSALYLGVLYDTGEGVAQNTQEAAGWYRVAADRGSATAALNLGVLYDGGGATMRDPVKAVEWYRRAAALGSARAAYNLGLIYQDGLGTPADRALAARYFEQASRQGLGAAQAHLAALHVHPPQMPRHAERDGTLDGFAKAQRALLARGPENMANAVDLFRRAAPTNPMAAYDLAYCYENGLGVPQDWAAALHWYRQAGTHASDPRLHELAETGANAVNIQLTARNDGKTTR